MELKGKKILVVDDEEDLCEILQFNLENEGFNVEIAHSAEEALDIPVDEFDLILLDVMMGQMSGFRYAEILRLEKNISVPVIFLTAKDTEHDILTGFGLGADDYISKPFSINELKARVNAVLKRSGQNNIKGKKIFRHGDMELDTVRKRVMIKNEKIELPKKEYEILKLLMENYGKIFSRQEILDQVWEDDVIVTERNVDVNITRLRNKLGKHGELIKNKSGYGYYFEE